MRIHVKIIQGRDCYPVVTEETSILELKSLVASELDIPVDKQRLVFEGKSLQDGMTLHQCGVKDGNKVVLFVKDTVKAEAAAPPVTAKTIESFTSKLDLKKELYQVLIRHFMPTDAQTIGEQFLYDLHDNVQNLSLDDIERIAQANIQNQKSS